MARACVVARSGCWAPPVARGSTRAEENLISDPPTTATPAGEPEEISPGNPGFLDSAYAPVQSDVGLVGTLGLVIGLVALAVLLARPCVRHRDGATWAAFAVLVVSMIDWLGRSSLASYTTGFLTMYVLGILIAARRPPPDRTPAVRHPAGAVGVERSPG